MATGCPHREPMPGPGGIEQKTGRTHSGSSPEREMAEGQLLAWARGDWAVSRGAASAAPGASSAPPWPARAGGQLLAWARGGWAVSRGEASAAPGAFSGAPPWPARARALASISLIRFSWLILVALAS